MTLWKCRDCHNEWEGNHSTCEWCFTPLAKKIEFTYEEKMKHGDRRKAS